jgi:NAD(P)H-quinone oxidoreductase subunit I
MVTPLREYAYLPKGVDTPHGLPPGSQRAGQRPEELLEKMESESEEVAASEK